MKEAEYFLTVPLEVFEQRSRNMLNAATYYDDRLFYHYMVSGWFLGGNRRYDRYFLCFLISVTIIRTLFLYVLTEGSLFSAAWSMVTGVAAHVWKRFFQRFLCSESRAVVVLRFVSHRWLIDLESLSDVSWRPLLAGLLWCRLNLLQGLTSQCGIAVSCYERLLVLSEERSDSLVRYYI